MDRYKNHEMTVEEAKERLRRATAETGLVPWARRHPLEAAVSALLLGLLAGSGLRSRDVQRNILHVLARLL